MSRGDTAERAAESLLAIVAIWLYDEKWICLTSSGQHKDMNSKRGDPGAKLAGGLAEQHQPATTCILLLSQPPWILFLPPAPPAPSSSLTSLICIPAISYTPTPHICIWSVHHTAWILCDGNSVASAANVAFILLPRSFFTSCKSDDYPHLSSRPGNQKWPFFWHLLKFKWILTRN